MPLPSRTIPVTKPRLDKNSKLITHDWLLVIENLKTQNSTLKTHNSFGVARSRPPTARLDGRLEWISIARPTSRDTRASD